MAAPAAATFSAPTHGPAMGRVFVIGVGMTKFYKPGSTDLDYPQLAKEAVTKALSDAGISYTDVQHACVGYVYGDSTCGQRALYEVGMTGIPIYNVNNNCATGATALAMAHHLIRGGICDCALALGFDKMSKGSLKPLFDDRTNPIDKHVELLSSIRDIEPAPMAPQLFGAAGREHMEKYNTKPEHFAKIAWKNHKHSTKNPLSQFTKEYSLEEILNSPTVYFPLTRLQCCPTSDGAAAAILASERFVREHGLEKQAVEIVGLRVATDPPSTFGDKSCMKMVGFDMTKNAAERLYQETGIYPTDVNVVELHDCFSANELITYEALGLCDIGKAAELIDSGNNTYGGKYVINPSGGLISKGHPLGATGIAQCAELCWQLRKQAGERQVPNAKVGLQHNLGLGGAVVLALYRLGFPNAQSSDPSSTESRFKSYDFFQRMRRVIKTEKDLKIPVSGSILFTVTKGPDDLTGHWLVKLQGGTATIEFMDDEAPADCTLTAMDSVLADVAAGKLDIERAFFQGKIKIKGNVSLLMKLMPLQKYQSKL